MKTGPFTFTADDGAEWRITGLSESCGQNYVDVERVDGTKKSVRQTGIMRLAGHEIPDGEGGSGGGGEGLLGSEAEGVSSEVPAGDAPSGGADGEHALTEESRDSADEGDAGSSPASEDQVAPARTAWAGRFVLCTGWPEHEYITSWDTWEEAAAAAYPLLDSYFFHDSVTNLYLFPGWEQWAVPQNQ